ncbi:MAG: isoprenylcysteine carboxylmethyltransferase family protein [FCB group bacterium]|nr:isoprenylcysteine carboxylmethyltransferase family protein [FCB group bacterium]
MFETALIVLLFLGYLALWVRKRRIMKQTTGIDPEVMRSDTDPLQRYMYGWSRILTIGMILIIVFQWLKIDLWGLLTPFPILHGPLYDGIGFTVGILGLVICFLAQQTMGLAWRVGIDTTHSTPLIKSGIYGYSRNPTYLGLFLLLFGVMLIWPLWGTVLYFVLFLVFIEVQVRCEESFLRKQHGKDYTDYTARVRRYIGRKSSL